MKRPRVLIADDHRIVVAGLQRLLEPDFELVGAVEDGRALIAAAEKLKPDVILADISMPLLNGIEAARQIRKNDPKAKIIFLTMHADMGYAIKAFEAGASGYLVKRSVPAELQTAVREVLKGLVYVTPLIAKEMVPAFLDAVRQLDKEPSPKLTSRQREVLQLLAEGHSVRKIADILNVSHRTVEYHKYTMMNELGVRTNAELTQFALRHGIISS